MKKYIILSAAALALSFSSCEDYLDVNTDPNSPSESNLSVSELFPSVEMQLAATYGGDLRSVGGYHAQHYSQDFGTSNWLDYSQFEISATRCSDFYSFYMQRCLSNIATILSKAAESEDWGTYLAATTLRVFIFQNMVDCWGEIPYTEILDPNNTSPKYDDGADIYAGILAELDAALEKVSASDFVCTNFLFPSESADSWIKFANALKLRILMRESNVKDVQAQLQALIEEDNFPEANVQFEGCFANEKYSYSPFYDNNYAPGRQNNIIGNLAIIGTLQQKDAEGNIVFTDGRLEKYFETNGNGEYTGGVSGTNFSSPKNKYTSSYWCRPVASATDPVVLISVAETEFFLSEYYARYGSEADAKAHYEAAINASFDAVEADGADDYLAKYPFTKANYAKILGLAKWVDLSGYNSFEAWCELRRLGYPTFAEVKGSDIYDVTNDMYKPELYKVGTLYTPIQVFGQVGENQLLARYPYPESSTTRNSNSPTFPGYTAPVFWAVK